MPGLDQWRQLWARLGAALPNDLLFHELIGRYSEGHRKYHTTRHLDECFEKLKGLENEARHPEEVEFALWFHDVIYDVKRRDNEAKSADWARLAALTAGVLSAVAERVHALVLVTAHNAVPRDIDQRVLVDVDLSILGAKAERFDEYEIQIREEYSWVPEIEFRSKRRDILSAFLQRPIIFSTQRFIDAYEAQARKNLERSIKRLGG
jgi:predicted metal-dependent HD superfamily phosphohydrolase